MDHLLAEIIDAHGGQARWDALHSVSARLLQGGAIWTIKRQEGVLADVRVTADLHAERVSHSPFGAPGLRTAFSPRSIAILEADGTQVEAMDEPRGSFAGHTLETPWSRLQLGYFVGTAMWTYLTQPFSFALPGFTTREVDPIEHEGARLRRLQVTWPADLATHSTEQTVYVGDDGLLVRHDYDVEIAGNTPGAHFLSDYVEVDGIQVPTRHRIYPRLPDGSADIDTLVVSIDLSDISFS